MKRFLSLCLLSVVCAVNTSSAQILYKISGNGLQKPSFIMGTYHLQSIDFIEQVNRSQIDVEQFCGELSLEEYCAMEEMNGKAKVDSLPNGQTLKDIFTAEEFELINKCTKDAIGINFNDDPSALQRSGRLMPGVFSYLIQQSKLMEVVQLNGCAPLDVGLLLIGKSLGKSVIGLESAEFQYKLLSQKPSLKVQKKQLIYVCKHWQEMFAAISVIKQAYQAQDIKPIQELLSLKEKRRLLFGSPAYYKALLTKRDADWAKRMPDIMRQKPTFFFVGIFHLAGKPGVLNLLRRQGYTVEAVR